MILCVNFWRGIKVMLSLKQAVDGLSHPREIIWSSFPMDRNSKISLAGQSREETGPFPDKRGETTYFSFSRLRRSSWLESSLELKRGVMSSLPTSLFTGIHLGWKMRTHTQEDSEVNQIWTQNRQIKMIGQRKHWRSTPYKWFKLQWRHDSLSVHPHACPHVLYSPPSAHFTSFTIFHLCGKSLPQSQRARALSLTTGLVARIQLSLKSLAGNWNPASSCCRPREIIVFCVLQTLRILLHPIWIKILTTLLTCVWVYLKFYSCNA